MRTYELFINGEFIPNGDRECCRSSTRDGGSDLEVPKATAADVEAAIDAAAAARKEWAKTPPIVRAATSASCWLVADNRELFARTNSEEMGKPLAQSMDEAGWLTEYLNCSRKWRVISRGQIITSTAPMRIFSCTRCLWASWRASCLELPAFPDRP